MTSTAEIRQQFINYFASRGHEVVASSPLVPNNDNTLLFTNAGMVQFKDLFLGLESRDYTTAVTSQRCVRAGGKHNDLENVGYTARHHTFFEMLGNFSFGDYFKREAIEYAWEFLTSVLGLPTEKLWVTVFEEDDEAEALWRDHIGVPPERIKRIGAKDNFWSMGDTGPCGPCSEIFYDHGPDVAGGPPGSPDEDGDRYIEIWNLVFMQFDRDSSGNLTPLPKPSVDTGMGLERLAAILQHKHNNYEIDLFQRLIAEAAKLTGCDDLENQSLRVIADHIRSCAFLVVDGVLPSNEGRGYVLRRIIRRAARHGHQLGQPQPFFYKLVDALVEEMGTAYPELTQAQTHVKQVLEQEEVRFAETLSNGMQLLEKEIARTEGERLDSSAVFKLYDTYGFPVDLTADVAREHGLTIDLNQFERDMDEQRKKAQAAGNFAASFDFRLDKRYPTQFTGYEQRNAEAKIVAIVVGQQQSEQVIEGVEAIIVTDITPFYAESGGQVGDTGIIASDGAEFSVSDTQKMGESVLHIGRLLSGRLSIGDSVRLQVDNERRDDIMRNHSATHLMHHALREVLGEHVQQKGSLVNQQMTRFDFSHFQPVAESEIGEIEARVNTQIAASAPTQSRLMDIDSAKEAGALALFGEKYGDEVRVLSIGNSTELCGGTHVENTADIGLFKLDRETGISSGVRRVTAYTGSGAITAWANEMREAADALRQRQSELSTVRKEIIDAAAALQEPVENSTLDVLPQIERLEQQVAVLQSEFTSTGMQAIDNVKECLTSARESEFELQSQIKRASRQLEQLKAKLSAQAGGDLAADAVDLGGLRVVAANLENADPKSLRDTVDQLKNKLGSAVIVLATSRDGKVNLCAGVTRAETTTIKAGDLVNHVAQQVGGKGGGRPDMAQAGGSQPENLDAALQSVVPWVESKLDAS